MSTKPIFMATHPRACSTAFERVFMTRRDSLTCVHEPFGDAFYFGPERLSARYANDRKSREESGLHNATFKAIFDNLERKESEGKRLFIKDIIHYLVPPNGKPAKVAPSLRSHKRGVGTNSNPSKEASGTKEDDTGRFQARNAVPSRTESENPTVVPVELLAKFHFTFLIRDPHASIPSYYRCTIPPLDKVTGFYEFSPSEAGYDEVRRVFDFLRSIGQIGPHMSGTMTKGDKSHQSRSKTAGVSICVVDADDLLDNPSAIIQAYCKSVGLKYEPEMLNWDSDEEHVLAKEAFEKWKGFHEDAIHSKDLKPRSHKKRIKIEAEWDEEWKEKYGVVGGRVIRETVDKNMGDYMYMKQFAMKG